MAKFFFTGNFRSSKHERIAFLSTNQDMKFLKISDFCVNYNESPLLIRDHRSEIKLEISTLYVKLQQVGASHRVNLIAPYSSPLDIITI